jgi:translation initiation factor 2 subunit 2
MTDETIPTVYPDLIPGIPANTFAQMLQPPPPLAEDDEIALMFAKKKKKKKVKDSESGVVSGEGGEQGPQEPDESYEELLSRIYTAMGVKQDDSSYVRIKPPKTEQVGGKKTAWLNFRLTCATLNRSEEHVNLFVSSELGVLTSITDGGALLIRGIFPGQKLEGLIRKYMENYVKCVMCRATKTVLRKDTISRLMMMDCNSCKASRSVAAIQTGFHATTKSDRKKAAREDD